MLNMVHRIKAEWKNFKCDAGISDDDDDDDDDDYDDDDDDATGQCCFS